MVATNMNTYQYGTTVRFEASFFDFDGNAITPDLIKITIYDYKYNQVFSQTLDSNYQLNTGQYFYDYITDPKEQKLYYEWYGEINSKPTLQRGTFMTKFI